MMEQHFVYKIMRDPTGLICTELECSDDTMLDVLTDIRKHHRHGICWIFRQDLGKAKEALCIIDCEHARIYYHHSGDVESLDDTIQKLSHSK